MPWWLGLPVLVVWAFVVLCVYAVIALLWGAWLVAHGIGLLISRPISTLTEERLAPPTAGGLDLVQPSATGTSSHAELRTSLQRIESHEFTIALLREKQKRCPKWRDYERRVPQPTGRLMSDEEVIEFASEMVSAAATCVDDVVREFGVARSGTVDSFRLATSLMSAHERLADIATRIRTARTSDTLRAFVRQTAALVDEPRRQIQWYVDGILQGVDDESPWVAHHAKVDQSLALSVDTDAAAQLTREARRLIDGDRASQPPSGSTPEHFD